MAHTYTRLLTHVVFSTKNRTVLLRTLSQAPGHPDELEELTRLYDSIAKTVRTYEQAKKKKD